MIFLIIIQILEIAFFVEYGLNKSEEIPLLVYNIDRGKGHKDDYIISH